MPLTQEQLATLKAAILADPVLAAYPNNNDGHFEIQKVLNATASPDYWVWRTDVTRADIYHATSPAGTNWDWAVYKAQSQTEQGAWVQMFMGDRANFSLANLRGGIGTIFGGTAAQVNQRNHCLAAGRRKATRGEKLFSVAGSGVGNAGGGPRGATTNPDVLVVEGTISLNDIDTARNLL